MFLLAVFVHATQGPHSPTSNANAEQRAMATSLTSIQRRVTRPRLLRTVCVPLSGHEAGRRVLTRTAPCPLSVPVQRQHRQCHAAPIPCRRARCRSALCPANPGPPGPPGPPGAAWRGEWCLPRGRTCPGAPICNADRYFYVLTRVITGQR